MPDLHDLQKALEALKASAGSGRIYVYGTGEHGGAMQHGFFGVSAGRRCVVDFAKKSQDDALAEILALRIVKIISMPVEKEPGGQSAVPEIDIDAILERLSSIIGNRSDFGLVGIPERSEPVRADAANVKPLSDGAISLGMVVVERDALEILEKYYGTAASKKIAEIAVKSPPHEKPLQFLNACKQLAVAMIGSEKANQLFGPFYDKIQ